MESHRRAGGIVRVALCEVLLIGKEKRVKGEGEGDAVGGGGRGGAGGKKGGYSCQHFYTCRGTIASPRH